MAFAPPPDISPFNFGFMKFPRHSSPLFRMISLKSTKEDKSKNATISMNGRANQKTLLKLDL